MKNAIDIIIPTFNNLHELKNCMAGFAAQSFSDYRLLICVDGSTDDTVSYLKSLTPEKKILILEHDDGINHGRNAARNLALPFIESEYVIFLDSDLVPEPDFLQSHLNILKSGNTVSVGDIFWTNTKANIWAKYQATRGKNKYEEGDSLSYQYFCIGNSGMESEKLLQLNGFDEEMRHYGGNDNEFSFRLQKNFDLNFIFNQNALAKGAMNKDLNKALLQLSEFGAYNLHYLIEKFADFPNIFQIEFLKKNTLVHKLIWLDVWEIALSILFPLTPDYVKMQVIHYLTAKYLRKGFIEKKTATEILFTITK